MQNESEFFYVLEPYFRDKVYFEYGYAIQNGHANCGYNFNEEYATLTTDKIIYSLFTKLLYNFAYTHFSNEVDSENDNCIFRSLDTKKFLDYLPTPYELLNDDYIENSKYRLIYSDISQFGKIWNIVESTKQIDINDYNKRLEKIKK